MTKVVIILALGLAAAVFANPMDKNELRSLISNDLVEAYVSETLENVKDANLTCDKVNETCATADNADPNSVCHIVLRGVTCDNITDAAGFQKVLAEIQKYHPEAINPTAGQDIEAELQEEEAEAEDENEADDALVDSLDEEGEIDDEDDDYEDSGEEEYEDEGEE